MAFDELVSHTGKDLFGFKGDALLLGIPEPCSLALSGFRESAEGLLACTAALRIHFGESAEGLLQH